MIQKKIIILICISFVGKRINADWKPENIRLGLSNNITAKPFAFAPLFYSQYHPGITAGIDYNWKKTDKHRWHQTIKLGYNYHRFLQHNVELYTELGHDFILNRFNITPRLGAGVLDAIPATAVLKPNGNGGYDRVNVLGIPRFMVTLGAEISYKINQCNNTRVFLNYQNKLQTPFVKGYVPILPYVSITAGLSMPLSYFVKKEEEKRN